MQRENVFNLTQVLGLHARNRLYFPIYLHWKEQSKKSFEDVMNDVKKSDFIDEDNKPVDWHLIVQFCKKSIQKKIIDWQGELKVYYDAAKMEEELLKNPDNAQRISQGDWEQLILFWRRPKKQEEFEQNKRNRDRKRTSHTTGSQPFARVTHKMEMVIEKAHMQQLDSSFDPLVLSDVLDEVYHGHHGGYERFQGLGYSKVLWKDTEENKARRESYKALENKLEAILEENRFMKERLHLLEAVVFEKNNSKNSQDLMEGIF